MASNYVKGSFNLKGLDKLQAKISVVQDRLRSPGPVLQDIAYLFEAMEKAVFAGKGFAPEFGFNSPWKPLAESTTKHRHALGIPNDSDILVQYGYLRAAAINPRYVSIDLFSKEITLDIDPRNAGAPGRTGVNYAAIQNRTRPFAEMTPIFRTMAKDIARQYFFGPFRNNDVPLPGATLAKKQSAPALRGGARGMERGPRDHITRRRFPIAQHDQQAAYAKWHASTFSGKNLDLRSTEAKSLQSEYSRVHSTNSDLAMMNDTQFRGSAGTTAMLNNGFASRADYTAARQRVGMFNRSNLDGNAAR
jgi:hypothetical protein